MRIRLDRPARKWTESLPVGNGNLGGMVYGGLSSERVSLNEDTLWSSGSTKYENPQSLEHLAEVRRLLFEGKYVEGEKLAQETTTARNWERFGASAGRTYRLCRETAVGSSLPGNLERREGRCER